MRQQILEVAARLVQTRGYDGFSYADIATEVGIRKATIHHYFPTKGVLGRSLVERFRTECRDALALIDAEASSASDKLESYIAIFDVILADGGRMCLCGILAAGHETLPAEVKTELNAALSEHEAWLAQVVRQGQQSGLFRSDVPAEVQAMALFASLEGALLLARVHGNHALFRSLARAMTTALGPATLAQS